DRVTVLRDGRNAGELPRSEIRHEAMVRLMVGRELKQFFQRMRADKPGSNILEVRGLRWAGPGEPVSFTLRAGEVVGMAGLMGAGRTELAETIFGMRPRTAGQVRLLDEPLRVRKPIDAIRAGIYLVPEDRRTQGLVLPESVRDNIALPSLD